ncbi:Uncharacterised protein [Gordonia paraffinivorans]|uniref:Uncharacterized protein n=1 Tax=Gordonia paraffinivorans TaxID=175628 RepID=A0ABD7V2T9_9ACTN|nr:hypothetical protein [Gordonia paraffinivorans]VFA88527.1 Uncharacterised protein [Gordonia paraffinivorans]
MRLTRLAAAGIGLAASAAVVFAGNGEASAALLLPSAYPHAQTLTDGTLSLTVTNSTTKTATCWVSIHDASKESQLDLRAAAVNAILGTGIPSSLLDNARADAAQGALEILWDARTIAKDASATGTWNSNRANTSYAIYQECTTPDPVTGLTINGLAQVYKVTGTGKPADGPGGDDGPDNSGNGSLSGLFGGLA